MAEEIQPTHQQTQAAAELECIPVEIRIESWLETLIPLQEMCITPFDDSKYELSADTPVVGHLFIKALQEATDRKVNLEDATISMSGYGMYVDPIGDYGFGSMGTMMDGWMFRKNASVADYGISTEPLEAGNRIEFYYTADWMDVVFSDLLVNKSNVNVGEEITLTLNDVDRMSGISDAVIYINGEPSEYITDGNGQVDISFDTAGSYSVSAERYESDPEDMGDNNNIIRPVPVIIEVKDVQETTVTPDTQVTNVIQLIQNLPAIHTADETTKLQLTQARTAYAALTPEQKSAVRNVDMLVEKENQYTTLANALVVEQKINQLPTVEALVWENQAAVEEAILAYENLSADEKNAVTNYTKLEALKTKLATLLPTAITPQRAYETASEYMVNKFPNPQFGYEWIILALARGGYTVPENYFETYYNNVVNYVQSVNGELHSMKYTEYSRLILALASIGKDPTNVGGYNLVAKLDDFDKVVWQGINGSIFGLIALDSWDFELTESATTTREKLINDILAQQLPNGGFALGGNTADPDVTGMTIQALAPYISKSEVKTAVEKALTVLATIQNENGGYGQASESAAQVITALTILGIDPLQDERFSKTMDNLLSFYSSTDGGFKHLKSEVEANIMATEQAAYTLASYMRFVNNETSLYDMSDTMTKTITPTEPPEENTTPPSAGGNEQTTPPSTGGNEQTAPPQTGGTEQSTPTQYGQATISIVASKTDIPLAATTVEIFENESVFNVLKRVTSKEGIPLNYRTSGYGIYIDGINGLSEFDKGPQSGWMYRVNGTFPSYSAALYTVKPNDKIEWLYTLDFGKDIGGYVEEAITNPGTSGSNSGSTNGGETAAEKPSESEQENETETPENAENSEDQNEEQAETKPLQPTPVAVESISAEQIQEQLKENPSKIAIQGAHDSVITFEAQTLAQLQLQEGEKVVSKINLKNDNSSIDITIAVEKKDGSTTPLVAKKEYVNVTLPLEEVTKNTVVLQSINGEYRAVPHKINDGKVVISTKTSGTFVVMENHQTFKDIEKLANKEDIEFLASRHIIKGKNEEQFMPNKAITRGQFAAMISRALGLQASEDSKFKDVKGKWYERDIQALYEAGITTGKTDTSFDPEATMSRQQAAAFMARVLQYVNYEVDQVETATFTDSTAIQKQFQQDVNLLNSLNIMTGKNDGSFDPKSSLTRAQTAKILKRTLNIAELM